MKELVFSEENLKLPLASTAALHEQPYPASGFLGVCPQVTMRFLYV